MSSPLIKISDESWSLVCLCCSCTQEVRDLIKMSVGPAFVEYNHRFTCPHCQTYNQIMLTRSMFDNAQTMVFQAEPPKSGGQNAPPFNPDEFSSHQQSTDQTADRGSFSFDFNLGQAPSGESQTNNETPPSEYKPSVPSFEAVAQENKAPRFTPPPPKPPSKAGKKSSLDEEIEADGLEELLGKSKKGKTKGKDKATQESAQTGTIEVFGQKIPLNNQTKALAGLGSVLVIVVLYFFVFSGGEAPPIATTSPTPTPSASVTPKKTASPTPIIPDLPKYPPIELKMIEIPAGSYTIGSTEGEDKEKPPHTVEIKAFLIDNREVTKEEYAKFIKEAKYKAPESWVNGNYRGDGKEPITEVTWADAQAYAKWAGKRLPTEEEWEIAAGGKDHSRYPWGSDWDNTKANTKESAQDGIKPAGAFLKGISPTGLYDMSGNVWEWTDSKPLSYPGSPFKITDGDNYRVIRGGSHKEGKAVATTYSRNWIEPTRSDTTLGFRCAKDAP
ncbi:MAG: SUMF1/EgtB/PvdO family nonheme iron enzyme [Acidobacteria bacterium]|nr:SUMF1/EgtB/PvdO family nonheme iron enzyme [Acidobacteriota bacterium]